MAEGVQEDASDYEYSASAAAEQGVAYNNSDKRGRGSKCNSARKNNTTRRDYNNYDSSNYPNNINKSNNCANTNNITSSSNNSIDRNALAQPKVKAVLIISVLSVALSLATFVASLGISDSPVGVVASVLECVVAVGIFGVGLYGTLREDPSFLALYTVFGICMALAQMLWVVLGSYSIYQLNASLRVTKDEEQIAAIKGALRNFNVYVATAVLSIVGYSLVAFFARKLKVVYQQASDTTNTRNQRGKKGLGTNESEDKNSRHATVAVASPFA